MLTALSLSATEVAAQPLSLAWDAPAGCPSQAAVLEGVERIVGRPLNELSVPWTSAHGAVVRQQEGWLLQVIVVGADGTRNTRLLAAASCTEAAEAASVVLATSLGAAQSTATPVHAPGSDSMSSHAPTPNPSLGPGTAPPNLVTLPAAPLPSAAPPSPAPVVLVIPAAPVDPPPAVPAAVQPGEQSSLPAAQASSASVGSVGARLGVDTVLLGEPVIVVGVVGGVEFAPASLRAFANATDSVDHEAPGTEGGARIAIYAGGVQGCLSLAGVTLRLEGCAGGQVGVLRANGYGVAGTHVDSVFWSAGQGSAVLRWRRGTSGSLWLEAELVVPFRRLYVELADVELHRTASASAQLWLGFSLDL